MEPFVSLTFDDGHKSAINTVFPLLQTYNIPATFYIISDYLDDLKRPPEVNVYDFMNVNDLKKLDSYGYKIGAHTKSHVSLTKLSEERVIEEVRGSKEALEKVVKNIQTFAYPFGDCNVQIVKHVENAGYIAARSINKGYNNKQTNRFKLLCQWIQKGVDIANVDNWLNETKKHNYWLILMFHAITEVASRCFDAAPKLLKEILISIKEKESPIVTVEEGIRKLE